MMRAFVFVVRQIPPAPLLQRGVIYVKHCTTYPPLAKGGRGDLHHPYPGWSKR